MPYIGYDPSAPGTISIQRFTAGTDFTAGSTTTLTITYSPGSANNIDIYFDGQYQHHDQWSISGNTITFTAAIPLGTAVVEVKYGNSVAIGTPADGTVTAAKMAVPVLQFSGRLTLATATPIMTSDQTAKTTIYFTPYMGNQIPIYDGTRMVQTEFSELSQATTDATKSPAAVTTNSNYDLFVWNDSGTIRCTRGPAWSSDTARGTGAGTTELEMVKGVYTNKVAITNGPAANRGTYVGTVRSNGSSQIDWKLGTYGATPTAQLFVWNMYNRVVVAPVAFTNVDNWTYGTSAFRVMNNDSNNSIQVVRGLDEDGVRISTDQCGNNNTSAIGLIAGIGVDSTSTASRARYFTVPSTNIRAIVTITYTGLPGLGFHTFYPLENGQGAGGTTTWEGDAGTSVPQNGIYGSVLA